MYVAQLNFEIRHTSDDNAISHAINGLLAALRMNGQVCGREWPIAAAEQVLTTFVMITAPDALDDVHHNDYVKKAIAELSSGGLGQPHITILGENIDGLSICQCTTRSSFILYTNYLTLESPLRCGDCFLPIPLYKIPPTYDGEYYDIICWQSDYQSCDSLQMNSSVLERAATNQMSRIDSQLTHLGRQICNHITTLTGTPTYYYLYRYGARSRAQELKRRCPSCKNEWLLDTPFEFFDFKCSQCCLLSNIAWDVR